MRTLACDFCATGRLGGIRNLATWEIVAQIRRISAEAEHPIRGVVFMGMGEPLLNYANVMRAGRILSDPSGPAISAKAQAKYAKQFPKLNTFTIEQAFGGWAKADKDHFADNASFDQIYTKK